MKYLFVFMVAISISGCANFREYQAQDAPDGLDETSFVKSDAAKFNPAEPVVEWWDQLGDVQLSNLIDSALRENLDVRIAVANLFEARAITRETVFDRFPTVTASGSLARQRLSDEGISGEAADNSVSLYEAGFDAFWELDLFGRINETIAAEKALDEAALADLENVYVSVAAEVARTYIELRGAQYRLDIANRNAANQQKTLSLTETLTDGGRSTQLDVSRATTQLNLTRATIPPLEAEANGAINRLSVLTGQIPDALHQELTGVQSLPSIPPTLSVGEPSGLLKRRPDIRRAERELAATVAQYNVSVTDLFPRIQIIGSLGFEATDISSFATSSAFTGSIGPAISWSAFDIGRVRARIAQSDARSQGALASYEKTVLDALEEVQTSLVNFLREEQRRDILRKAARSSAESSTLARQRFDAGVDDFLDVLDAERTQLEAEDSMAVSEITAALNLIAIYKALGGGWQI